MDNRHLLDYEQHRARGLKTEARAALERFIASFEPEDDRQGSVRELLERGGCGHTIRHELFEQVVFPILHDGYLREDVWSIVWLAKLAQNLYRAPSLHACLEFKSEQQLLREAHRLDPGDPQIRRSLLETQLRWFQYCQHEWPAGILHGADGASISECEEILDEIRLARELDESAEHEPFLEAFERRTRDYQERLRSLAVSDAITGHSEPAA